MKLSQILGLSGAVGLAVLLTGCGKSDSSSAETKTVTKPVTAEAAAPQPEPVAMKESNIMASSKADLAATAAKALADFKMPDLPGASASQLAASSSQTLDQVAALSLNSNPQVASMVDSLKASLSADQAVKALMQLPQLAETVKSVPGGTAAIGSAQKMISAWALKQNFEPAMVLPALRALQTGDYANLASQASQWMGTGELSDQQQQIIRGVLANYGLDLPAAEVLNKLKGFL